jgi:type I restriction enzyme S subunit
MSWSQVDELGKHTTLISSGSTPLGGSKVYLDDGPVLFIRSQNVLMNRLDLENAVYISDEADQKIGRTRLQAGDVLLNITGASIGRVASFDGQNRRANVNQHVCVIRPNPRALNARYLSSLIATPEFQRRIQQAQVGGTRQALTFSQIADFKVPLPPIAEQRRIAEVLDRAEALRAKRRAALAQLDTLTQSIFLDLFGDPLRNTKKVKTAPLQDLCVRITDGTHQPPKWAASGHPFLFVSNIISGEINFDTQKFISDETHASLTRRCPIEVGDVLYSTVGSYGIPAKVRTPRKFAFQRHIAHLKPNPAMLDSEFLCAMLASPPLRRQADRAARGMAQKTVNLAEIAKFIAFCPPLSDQRKFTRNVAALQRLKTAHRASITELDALFAALQHRAFRGEL